MFKLIVKFRKPIAVGISVIFLLTAVPLVLGGLKANRTKAANSDEKTIAGDISNMTGVKIEEIIDLRNKGNSWNEVLSILKKRNSGGSQGEKDKRSELLALTELGDDYLEKLKFEGFTNEEISEVKMLAERMLFQLQEITGDTDNKAEVPKVELETSTEDDTKAYSELLGKFDVKTACYLMLKLKKDYDGIEKVLDEYLYSLQIGVNLEERLIDKASYKKQRDKKGAGMDPQKIITLQKIDEKVLKKIQDDNAKNAEKEVSDTGTVKTPDPTGDKNDLPEIPIPEVKDVKPKNPADEIMKEIEAINPTGN